MRSIVKKLLSILNKKQKTRVIILGIMILLGGVLETVGIGVVLPLVQAIMDAQTLANNKYVIIINSMLGITNMKDFILVMILIVIIVFVIKNAYLLLLTYVQNRFVNNNQFLTVSYMLEEYLNRPYEFYLNADFPTLFRTVDSDVPRVFTALLQLISLAGEIVVSIFLVVYLLFLEPKMTILIGVILFGITLLIVRIMKPKLNAIGGESQAIQSRMGKWRLQSIYGIKDVKILNKESYFVDNFDKNSREAATLQTKYMVINSMPRMLLESLSVAVVLGYMAIRIIQGSTPSELLPQITVFATAAFRLLPSVNRINGHITNIAYCEPSVDYVYENVDFSDYSIYGVYKRKSIGDRAKIKIKDAIVLKNITYAYPNTDKMILDKANMRIPIGKAVGVMGPSGAGKTTAIDILMGLLKPSEGTIKCGGVDVMENYSAWLSNIGYIPQTIFLTDDTIRENIAFGTNKLDIDDERIWKVLEDTQMADHVRGLSEGLDTTVGERGVRLSGGQRQRIGIARALYHDPDILVFDEATSSLDNDTESAIMDAIEGFKGSKTIIIIAHRLRTIESCDIIYNVKDGQIIETRIPYH